MEYSLTFQYFNTLLGKILHIFLISSGWTHLSQVWRENLAPTCTALNPPKNQPHAISPEPEPQLPGDLVSSHIWYHLTCAFINPLFPISFLLFFFPSTPAGVDNCSLRESPQILECKVIPELRIPRLLTKTRGTFLWGASKTHMLRVHDQQRQPAFLSTNSYHSFQ